MTDHIRERDLPVSIPGPTDFVRFMQGDRSMRAPARSLPMSESTEQALSGMGIRVDEAVAGTQALNASVETRLSAMDASVNQRINEIESIQSSGMIGFDTKSAMDADLAHDEGALALVTNDPSPSNNGTYRKSGASESGSWVVSADRTTQLQQTVGGAIVTAPVDPQLVPLFIDGEGNVPLWLEDGLLAARGLAESLLTTLGISTWSAPARQPLTSRLPNVTEGRSLWAWRSKLATIDAGGNAKARLLITGDSWTEFAAIPAHLATVLRESWEAAGYGWLSVRGVHLLDGVTMTVTGWTLFDASIDGDPTYGTGVDGHYITATGASAAASIGNCQFTDLHIYYRRHGGTFRWRVDGGAWNTVTADSAGTLGIEVASGFTDTTHSVEIDTTGNTGTVVLCGFLATRDVSGVELLKAGNAGLDSEMLLRFSDYIGPIASDIVPDVVVMILGTNDYRHAGATVEVYTAALEAFVEQYRAAAPDCGFIFIAPADTDGVAVRPLVQYRDALYRFCIEGGHEFYNMHDEWPSHAAGDAAGMWTDNLHLNDNGARCLARRLNRLLLGDK